MEHNYNSKTKRISYERYHENREYFDTGLIETLENQQAQIKKYKKQEIIYRATIFNKNITINMLNRELGFKKSQIRTLQGQLKGKELDIDETIKQLEDELKKLEREIQEELQKAYRDNDKLHQDNQRLKKEIDGLKRKNHRLDSSNSSQPPSHDIGRKIPVSLREKSDRKRGGQTGHQPHHSQLADQAERVIEIQVKDVPQAAQPVLGNNGRVFYYRTQEIDVNFKVEVVETRYFINAEGCKLSEQEKNKYRINAVSYSDHLKALVLYLNHTGGIALERLSRMLNEMSESRLNLKESTIVNWNKRLADNSAKETEKILNEILGSKIVGVDETGWRINGNNAWLHTLTTADNAYYLVSNKRSDREKGTQALLKDYQGILEHDHFKPYLALECRHAECNAHIMRYLKAGREFDENIECGKMIQLLQELYHLKKEAIGQGKLAFEKERIDEWEKEYLNIAHSALDKYRLDNPNIARKYIPDYIKVFERMIEYHNEHLLFIKDFSVPFDNNDAERQIRVAKSKKKVSGQSYSLETANYYAIFLTISQTCRKQHINTLKKIEKLLG